MWLVTLNGVPQGFAWGHYKTQDEEADPVEKNRSAALGSQQSTGDGWDATLTAWRNVPPLLYDGIMGHASATAAIAGRTLTIDGASFDLDTAGRPCGGQEDCPPDATITDIAALCTLVEAVGFEVTFVEKGAQRRVTVYPSEPDSIEGVPSAIYRQDSDSQVVRTDA